jgi:hypothetical protein
LAELVLRIAEDEKARASMGLRELLNVGNAEVVKF